jgi:hypothetical protein
MGLAPALRLAEGLQRTAPHGPTERTFDMSSDGVQHYGFAHAQWALQMSWNHTRRIDGLWYRAEPWGILGDRVLAAAFREFARRRAVDDAMGYLSDVSSEPGLTSFRPMSASRQAHYLKTYLTQTEAWFSCGKQQLNLACAMHSEALALFGPAAVANTDPRLDRQRAEFLFCVAYGVNDWLMSNSAWEFWTSPEFLAHHKANLTRYGPRSALAGYEAPKADVERRRPVQNGAHAVVRFDKPE